MTLSFTVARKVCWLGRACLLDCLLVALCCSPHPSTEFLLRPGVVGIIPQQAPHEVGFVGDTDASFCVEFWRDPARATSRTPRKDATAATTETATTTTTSTAAAAADDNQ